MFYEMREVVWIFFCLMEFQKHIAKQKSPFLGNIDVGGFSENELLIFCCV